MNQSRKRVAVVDDDVSVREALPDLLRELGYDAGEFSSVEEFLASGEVEKADCIVLDLALPGMSALELERELIRRGLKIPIVIIAPHGDRVVRLRVREPGAAELLQKPFSDTGLLEALRRVLKPE